MNIYIDIETLPCEDPQICADLAAGVKPPGNLKKAETIAKWEAEEKPACVEEAIRKTAFDGAFGRVLCVGWAVDDEAPQTVIGDELAVLGEAFEAIRESTKVKAFDRQGELAAVYVGHNLTGFDLRFLWQRAVVQKIRMPGSMLSACKAKPWDKVVADTMLMWNPERDRRIALDRLCKALGVESSKTDMDGSKVYEEYKAGNLDKIATYCRDDVTATRECYRRMVFA